MYIAAQIIGILAVVLFILSYQFKKRKTIIAVNAFSCFLYVVQYVMLGAFDGAAVDILSSIFTVIAHNKDKGFIAKHTKFMVGLMFVSMIGAGAILYRNIFSLFSIAGAHFQVGAFWLTEEKKIRFVSFFGTPCWFIYNCVNHAYGPAFGSILSMVSIGLAIYRYDIRKVKEPVEV